MSPTLFNQHPYDFIGFGDEVPGILALVCAAREFHRQLGKYPRSLLLFKRSSLEGIGGHLVRGKLAYLDRSHPDRVRDSCDLTLFGDAPAIYKEFLRRSHTDETIGIALDPDKADVALRQMLQEAKVDILSNKVLKIAFKQGRLLTGVELSNGEIYFAKQFIDATVNAELAQLAGVKKLRGFETLGLPNSELPVTLVFGTEGLSVKRLQSLEVDYLNRLNDHNDREAQQWLAIATNNHPKLQQQLQNTLAEDLQKSRTMCIGRDYVDVRSMALAIAYHGFRGTTLSLVKGGMVLDKANIAVFPGNRLLWNALLVAVNATQAEALAQAGAQPTAMMLKEISYLEQWLKCIGATAIKPATELYIRHAGNVTGVVSPLSGAKMLAGGVLRREALGTFSYGFDLRGGVADLATRAISLGLRNYEFHQMPLFNIGIQHALLKTVPNLAVVSPASGFTGYGCAVGRIVEFNVGVAQAVGIACALAVLSGRPVAQVMNAEVRMVLEQTATLPKIYDQGDAIASEQINEFEIKMAGEIPHCMAVSSQLE